MKLQAQSVLMIRAFEIYSNDPAEWSSVWATALYS